MFNFEFEQKGDRGILNLRGELIKKYEDDVKAAFMLSLGTADNLVMNFDNVTDVDSGCLKLLCKLIQNSKKFKKTISLAGNYMSTMKQKIKGGAYECSPDCDLYTNSCLFGREVQWQELI